MANGKKRKSNRRFKKDDWSFDINDDDVKVRKRTASPIKVFKNKKKYNRKGKYCKPLGD